MGGSLVVSSISLSLMLDGGSVSQSPGEIRGGLPESKEDEMVISKTVAQRRRRSSACKTDMRGKRLGSRWKPIVIAMRMSEPTEIQTRSPPTPVVCRASRTRQWTWSPDKFRRPFSKGADIHDWAA